MMNITKKPVMRVFYTKDHGFGFPQRVTVKNSVSWLRKVELMDKFSLRSVAAVGLLFISAGFPVVAQDSEPPAAVDPVPVDGQRFQIPTAWSIRF